MKPLCNTTLDKLGDLRALAGRELSFAGIVTRADHRIAKSGKPFGSFIIEDHSGTQEFMLFSGDYLKFKVYLVQGTLLYVKARAQERTWGRDEGQMELKISGVDVLSDVREKYINRLKLSVDADRMDDTGTDRVAELLRNITHNPRLQNIPACAIQPSPVSRKKDREGKRVCAPMQDLTPVFGF